MTADDLITGTDTGHRGPAALPPAPRCWPHIARKTRAPAPRAKHHAQLPAPWPRRSPASGAHNSAGRDEHHRIPCRSGTRYRPGARNPAMRPGSGPRIVGHGWRAETSHRAGVHRPAGAGAWSAGGQDSRRAGPDCPEQAAAGPGALERRARRYDRRMAHGSGRTARHTEPYLALGASGSQHPIPGRTTRYPAVRPGSTDLPSPTTAPFAPGRRARRSAVRNPIRRTAPEDRARGTAGHPELRTDHWSRHDPAPLADPRTGPRTARLPVTQACAEHANSAALPPGTYDRRGRWSTHSRRCSVAPTRPTHAGADALRQPPDSRRKIVGSVAPRHRRHMPRPRRRSGALIGAALTTVIVAFPLGPGSTATAHSGDRSGVAQARTGVFSAARNPSDTTGGILPRLLLPAGGDPAGGTVTAPPPDLPAPAARTGSGSAHHPPRGAAPAAKSPSGSATSPPAESGPRSRPAAGSAAGSAAALGSASAVVPLIGEVLRALIRLAPLLGPPLCPCPRDRQ